MKFKPDLIGPAGMAWKCNIDAIRKTIKNPRPDTVVTGWIVSAPWANPCWHSYAIECIHLRSVPDVPAPQIYLTGATHELFVHAIDPEWKISPIELIPKLMPKNFAGQFICHDDGAAQMRIEQTVKEIINGQLNPDTDGQRQWEERYGNHMLKPEYKTGRPDGITVKGPIVEVHGTGGDNMRKLIGPPKPPHAEN